MMHHKVAGFAIRADESQAPVDIPLPLDDGDVAADALQLDDGLRCDFVAQQVLPWHLDVPVCEVLQTVHPNLVCNEMYGPQAEVGDA